MALALLALFACDDGGGGIDSGVAGNKTLSEVTSAEADDICEATEAFAEMALPESAYRRAGCATLGLQAGEVTACREIQRACEQGDDAPPDAAPFVGVPLDEIGVPRLRPMCLDPGALESCDASVAELESCYEALLAQQSRALYAPRCESLASDAGPVVNEPEEPPVCAALEAKCPGLPPLLTSAPRPIEPDRDAGIIEPPPPPPPGGVSCADIAPSFDGSDCVNEGCASPVECDCDPFPMSLVACNAVRGCLVSVDCDAACEAGSFDTTECAEDLACSRDADCDGYYCVQDGALASCSRGAPGERCIDGGDCASGSCVAQSFDSSCAGTEPEGAACSDDAECASGICYFDFSVSSLEGTCSSGAEGEPCSSDDECQSGICAFGASGGECSEGGSGDPCGSDDECVSGTCAYGGRASATCEDGSHGAYCDSSFDCASQVCDTSSTTFESTCGYAPGDACQDGALDGVADCDGVCRAAQGSCGSALCVASCDGGSCGSVTLATLSGTDLSGSITLSNGDLTATTSGIDDGVRATLGKTTGAYYWEVTVDASSGFSGGGIGVTSASGTLGGSLGSAGLPGVGFAPSGTIASSGGTTLTACGFTTGDVIGVALDVDAAVVYFSVGGVWQAGGSPEDGTGGVGIDISAEAVHPVLNLWSGDVYSVNFGQATFAFPPPAGFEPLFE